MGYTFRTSGPWGPGLSSDLSPAQVDNNFWQAIQDIQAKAPQGVGIANFVVQGNQMTVVLTDHTLLGPYPLPMASINFRGEWFHNTFYAANDIITHGGSTYMVMENHTSAATFDPGANDGHGNDYYGLLLQNPACTLPAGGPAGQFLRKVTSGDYVTAWETASLDDLSDVVIGPHGQGNVLTWLDGFWQPATLPTQRLDDLSDVVIDPYVATGMVLTYEDGTWRDVKIPAQALAGLTDTAVSSPQAGQPLVWNGSAWADVSTVDIPCGGLTSVQGSITIYRQQGEVHRFYLIGTVTDITISGWPAGGQFARLVLEIQNGAGYGWAWPTNVMWPLGEAPGVTPGGTDVFILVSFDGGTTIYGNVVGQAFALSP